MTWESKTETTDAGYKSSRAHNENKMANIESHKADTLAVLIT